MQREAIIQSLNVGANLFNKLLSNLNGPASLLARLLTWLTLMLHVCRGCQVLQRSHVAEAHPAEAGPASIPSIESPCLSSFARAYSQRVSDFVMARDLEKRLILEQLTADLAGFSESESVDSCALASTPSVRFAYVFRSQARTRLLARVAAELVPVRVQQQERVRALELLLLADSAGSGQQCLPACLPLRRR